MTDKTKEEFIKEIELLRKRIAELEITDSARALKKSEALLLEMTTQVPGVVYQFYARLNGEMGFYYISDRSERILGLKPDLEGYFERFTALVIPEHRQGFIKSIEKAVKESSEWKYEGMLQKPTGEKIWFFGNSTPSPRENETVFNGIVTDITERKQAEERLKDIIDKNPMSIQIVDKEGFTLKVNPAHTKLFGAVPPPDYSFFNDPQLKQHGYGKLIERIKNGEVVDFPDTPYNAHDSISDLPDVPVWAHVVAFSINDSNGKPERFVFMHEDITERKKAEETLAVVKLRQKAILDNIPDIAWLKDTESRFIIVNAPFGKSCGVKPEDIVGKTDFDIWPSELAERYRFDDRDVMATGRRKSVEEPLADKEGKMLYIETIKSPISDAAGKIIGTVGIARDITERKKAEEQLQKSEGQLANAVNIARLGPWEYDVLNDLFIFNDSFYAIFRTTAEQVGGYTMSSADYAKRFVHPEDAAVVSLEVRKAIETDDPNFNRQLEHRIIYSNGEIGYISVHFFIIKDEQGRTVRTYGMNQDITERKRREEELKKEYIELKEMQERLILMEKLSTGGTLAAGIAHEIRNPLSVISMTVQYLQSKFEINDPRREYTESIIQKVERIDRIARGLTDYSKSPQLNIKNRNLTRILLQTISLIKVKCKINKIKTIQKISKTLPLVPIDEEKIDQVFLNIINNAIEAMPEGGELYIETGYDEKTREIAIKIKDTGKGFGPKISKHIFEPFFTTKKTKGGVGLGLSISHNIIIAHNGSIDVESKTKGKNKGATFIIKLPVAA